MQGQLEAIAQGVVYAVIVFFWMWLAKWVSDWRIRSQFDPNHEIEEASNLAVGLRRSGLYLGLAIGMLGALAGDGVSFVADIQELFIEGAVLSVLLLVAGQLTDKVVIHGIANDEAVGSGNVAVGLVEFGVFVATGLIASGSFAGEGGGLLSAIVFFALGQLALLIMAVCYERLTPYQVVDGIRNGNVAAGGMLSGMLIAFGFILRAGLAGPSNGWGPDLMAFGISAGAGIGLLLLFQWPIDRAFLPGTTLQQEIETDQNVAAISVAAAVKIALALVIAAVVI